MTKNKGTKIQIWAPEQLLKDFDSALELAGYKNRSEFLREAMRNLIKESK